MRINIKQLRKMIVAETKRNLREVAYPSGNAQIDSFVGEMEEEWSSMYDDGDPSMSALGKDGWQGQVDNASVALTEELIKIIQKYEDGLFNGEFYY